MTNTTQVDKLTVYSEMQLVRRRFNVYLDAAAPFDNAAREVVDNAFDQVQKAAQRRSQSPSTATAH